MKIRIVVFDGVDEIDFVGPYEVFRRAAKLVSGLDVQLATLEPQTHVTAANGLRFLPDGVLEDAVDLLVIPGGGWAARAAQGIRAEIERGLLPRKIAALHSKQAMLAGVCTGVMAIAAAGLLQDRPAITHRSALGDLRAAGARVIEARVVDDGEIVTCGGVTSSIDLALWLVERLWGEPVCSQIAAGIEYTPSKNLHVARDPEKLAVNRLDL